MIFGSHVIVYSKDATADRDFFGEVLGFFVGGRWQRLADFLRASLPRSPRLSTPMEDCLNRSLLHV